MKEKILLLEFKHLIDAETGKPVVVKIPDTPEVRESMEYWGKRGKEYGKKLSDFLV